MTFFLPFCFFVLGRDFQKLRVSLAEAQSVDTWNNLIPQKRHSPVACPSLHREVRVQSSPIQTHHGVLKPALNHILLMYLFPPAYLQVLGLNLLPCRRQDSGLSLHWHRQVSGLRGWFPGHSTSHTQPHSSSSHRWPAGHPFPSSWPSHWHSPATRHKYRTDHFAPFFMN